MEQNSKIRVNKFYSDHTVPLTKSGLNLKSSPTLVELWENSDECNNKKKYKIGVREEVNVKLFLYWILAGVAGEKLWYCQKNPKISQP